ncbi:hypothetical protein CL622_05505 [archaeon]|nr:hypothetical protein [archaeon]|tara:strand:+ start:2875 stop:3618 length:744 start_codon:yes stop_codon:yes gene_type:complete
MGISIQRLVTKGNALFLAYDQGLEHGPTDFNDKNVDPLYVIKLAKQGGFNAFICQKGIAQAYRQQIKVPLIIKLNGKTNLVKGEPISNQVCSVKEAKRLRAAAVGYTLYIGSELEAEMFAEFGHIQEEAHKLKLPVVAWIYPRGSGVSKRREKTLMSYAARVGLELGADIIKIKYNGNPKDLAWAVKCAGKTKIVISGGMKTGEAQLIKQVKEIKKSGCLGLAIGRNIWQHPQPLTLTNKIRKIVLR